LPCQSNVYGRKRSSNPVLSVIGVGHKGKRHVDRPKRIRIYCKGKKKVVNTWPGEGTQRLGDVQNARDFFRSSGGVGRRDGENVVSREC